MNIKKDFPKSPFVELNPDIRWMPSTQEHHKTPPLVKKLRRKVKEWRDSNYKGANKTTEALLEWWFKTEHIKNDNPYFQYYFCQREAIETLIYLYEIEQIKFPEGLMKFDSSGVIKEEDFEEHWLRFVIKMATGSGKTKTMGLAVVWSYFNRIYEGNTNFSKNFLIIVPNIIVLDRLKKDFDSLKMFREDPILPDNYYFGKNWKTDFLSISVHIQDQIKPINKRGNIFLTNIQRVYDRDTTPSLDDEDKTAYFLGQNPVSSLKDSRVKVEDIVRDIDELAILNDEAHHIHDKKLAWFKAIEDIHNHLKQRGKKLSFQLDTTATPKDSQGNTFIQTIVDYPLVEAIYQNIVKLPILPDSESRKKLKEKKSSKFSQRYRDYIYLGYKEWKKTYDEFKKVGKKSILFIMVDDTRNCDEVSKYLEETYPELTDKVLTIHTNNNGEVNEKVTGKKERELLELRKLANTIDDFENKYLVIVSVMMLKEGWDVKNVTTIVGLRPFTSKAKILPEQTLGRGLRKMQISAGEKLSVIGTDHFMNFVNEIKKEGVYLEEGKMGDDSPPRVPEIVEIDKDDESLNIEVELFKNFYYRDHSEISNLNLSSFEFEKIEYKNYTDKEIIEIYFRDIIDEEIKSVVQMTIENIQWRYVIGWFAESIIKELNMVVGANLLYPKIKDFIENYLFDKKVSVEDPSTMANVKTDETTNRIKDTFKKEINKLSIKENKDFKLEETLSFKNTDPLIPERYAEEIYSLNLKPIVIYDVKKTLFNKVVLDSQFEKKFVMLLENCSDIISYVRNYPKKQGFFSVGYINIDDRNANFYPDFIVKTPGNEMYIVETKGFPDPNQDKKMESLKKWCKKANSNKESKMSYKFLFIDQQNFEKMHPQTFSELIKNFTRYQ